MDPTTNLRRQLLLANRDWTNHEYEDLTPSQKAEVLEAHIELCELVLGLHHWIGALGGSLPKQWSKHTCEATRLVERSL